MSIVFSGVVVRNNRRIRLIFSNILAAGAFNPTLYSITSLTPVASSPNATQALVVPGINTAVELSLDIDLVIGGQYQVEADGVPCTDLTVTPTPSIEPFLFSAVLPSVNKEPKVDDFNLVLFGRDIVWTGLDFLENASGDLSEISGSANVKSALQRRLVSDGLPWDPTYGAKPRQYVDGSANQADTLRGSLEQQALADNRVQSAKATLTFLDNTDAQFDTQITLVGFNTPLTVTTPLT